MKTFASEDVPMSTCPFSMKLVTQLVPLVTLSIVVYMFTQLPMQLRHTELTAQRYKFSSQL